MFFIFLNHCYIISINIILFQLILFYFLLLIIIPIIKMSNITNTDEYYSYLHNVFNDIDLDIINSHTKYKPFKFISVNESLGNNNNNNQIGGGFYFENENIDKNNTISTESHGCDETFINTCKTQSCFTGNCKNVNKCIQIGGFRFSIN